MPKSSITRPTPRSAMARTLAAISWASCSKMLSVSSSSSRWAGRPCCNSRPLSRSTKSGWRNSSADTLTETCSGRPCVLQCMASRIDCSSTQAPSVTI
ncbi:hypothetical protein D3C80_1826290 [compost metagenome]